MFEEYYAPLPDREAYLDRIGLGGETLPPTAETLHRLIVAQLTHVPFENLDVYERGLCPELGVQALFDKIVTSRRGGYCFELNGLFQKLLESLGFSCYSVIVRIMRGNEAPYPAHRGIVAVLPEGKAYCDVGFGGPASLWPVPLGGEATPDGFRAETDGDSVYIRSPGEGADARTLLFTDMPALPVDFLPMNIHMARGDGSYFRMKAMANLRTADGSVSIDGDVLRIRSEGSLTERTLENRADYYAALRENFGIDLPLR